MFHSGEREVQGRAGVTEAARLVGEGIRTRLTGPVPRFILEQSFGVAASLDSAGAVWASVLAGPPGFIQPVDHELVRIDASYADPGLLDHLKSHPSLGVLVIDLAARRRMRLNGRAIVDGGAIYLDLAEVYPNCPRYIRPRRLLVRDAPPAPAPPVRSRALDARQRELVARADTFCIATFHRDGGADASHRGGEPGFVRVEGDGALAFPDYAGNNMFNSLGNLAEDPRAGLLFLDFDRGDALQVSGEASLDWRPEAIRSHPGASKLIVRFHPREVVELPGGGVRAL